MGLDGILLSKVKNVWGQNLQGRFLSRQWRMIQNFKRNWLVSSKLTGEIWQILTRAPKNLKNLHFNGLLLNKVDNVWAKKIYTEALENLKKLHFNRLLFNKVYNVWAKKKYRGVMFAGTEYCATFEIKLTYAFKYDIRNLANFHQSMFKSLKIRTLMGSFYPK